MILFGLSGCGKTAPAATGLTGDWRLIKVQGGPAIDVAAVTRDRINVLRLLPDSTWQQLVNATVVSNGFWSIKQPGAGESPAIVAFSTNTGTGPSEAIYQVWLKNGRLIIRILPDLGYQATYTRN